MGKFVQEVNNFGHLIWKTASSVIKSTIHAVCCCVDAPVRAAVMTMVQFNGLFGDSSDDEVVHISLLRKQEEVNQDLKGENKRLEQRIGALEERNGRLQDLLHNKLGPPGKRHFRETGAVGMAAVAAEGLLVLQGGHKCQGYSSLTCKTGASQEHLAGALCAKKKKQEGPDATKAAGCGEWLCRIRQAKANRCARS
ncbi:hypothetical protein MTO96_036563 [Rhipicephalus appendiculatus]